MGFSWNSFFSLKVSDKSKSAYCEILKVSQQGIHVSFIFNHLSESESPVAVENVFYVLHNSLYNNTKVFFICYILLLKKSPF